MQTQQHEEDHVVKRSRPTVDQRIQAIAAQACKARISYGFPRHELRTYKRAAAEIRQLSGHDEIESRVKLAKRVYDRDHEAMLYYNELKALSSV